MYICTLDFSNYFWFHRQVRTFLWPFIGCPHVLQHGFARPCGGGACSFIVIGAKENNELRILIFIYS